MNLRLTFLLITIAICSGQAAGTNDCSTTTNLCAPFTLQDQFGTTHDFKFPRSRLTVLTVADKKGSEGIEGWAHPLFERFGDKIDIAGLADVSSVPAPLRALVRSKFKKAIQHPVMLDWKGDITRDFNYTKGKANVYLIAADGVMLHHVAGDADADAVRKLGDRIENALPPATQANARSN